MSFSKTFFKHSKISNYFLKKTNILNTKALKYMHFHKYLLLMVFKDNISLKLNIRGAFLEF